MSLKAITIASVFAITLVMNVHEARGQSVHLADSERCQYWYAKVDPSVRPPETEVAKELHLLFAVSEEDAAKTVEAAECLLKLKGKTSTSTHTYGTVSFKVETRFPGPSVEVAALYYISAFFHKNWRHADAMILMDNKGRKNTKEAIKQAFTAYRSWLKKVQKMGLEEARKQNLDPLHGTSIRWYGNAH